MGTGNQPPKGTCQIGKPAKDVLESTRHAVRHLEATRETSPSLQSLNGRNEMKRDRCLNEIRINLSEIRINLNEIRI